MTQFLLLSYRHLLNFQGQSRTRTLGQDDLLEQLPALQQLLFRLVGCQVEEHTAHVEISFVLLSSCVKY